MRKLFQWRRLCSINSYLQITNTNDEILLKQDTLQHPPRGLSSNKLSSKAEIPTCFFFCPCT